MTSEDNPDVPEDNPEDAPIEGSPEDAPRDETGNPATDAADAGEAPDVEGDAPVEALGNDLGYTANLKPRPIESELKTSFLDYSMSVIVSRAIPDVRDGLKPVQRRILYAMKDMGLTAQSSYKKSARVVGEVLGKYHPHGDSSVYEAMVRMAQNFNLRYPLVDGQGNFGSIDGDRAAAMRYTEAKLAKIANEMMDDIDKETVEWVGNFDDSLVEPSVLPGRLPNLLVNGAAGIAVGMATNIPPHNLTEIGNALVHLIDNPDAAVPDLMEHVKGPDFPGGGIICGTAGIYSAYLTGRGRVTVRARVEVEQRAGDKEALIVTELPYQVNKANLLISIAELVKDKRIEGISDLRDESDRHGMRMVIELKRGVVADLILNQLYAHTQLQNNFNVLNLSLVGGQPKVLDLRDTLAEFLKHRQEIVRRRTEYDLKKAEEKLHLLEGLLIALDNIDAVIKLIRESADPEVAREGLMERFKLSELQAKAILDMRLSKLTSLEVDQVTKDHEETTEFVRWCERILASTAEMLKIIRDETLALIEKYGDERRSEITEAETDLDNEDLIPREDVLIVMTKDGYIKRMGLDTYRAQNRGGKGLKGMKVKEEDQVIHLFRANSHDWVMYFTDKGKVFWLKGYRVPPGSRQSKGKAIVNLLEGLEPDERIMTCIPTSEFPEDRYVFFATKKGKVKRTQMSLYKNVRSIGVKAIRLEDDDELLSVRFTDGNGYVMLATAKGQACTFREEDCRPMGRVAAGVRGIRLRPGDEVVSLAAFADGSLDESEAPTEGEDVDEEPPAEIEADVDEEDSDEGARPVPGEGPYVLSLTENGYGKVVHLGQYRLTNRGGYGVRTLNVSAKSGKLRAVRGVEGDEHILMSSIGGMVVRAPVRQIRLTKSRAATGVIVMRMSEEDKLQAVAVLPAESVDDEGLEDEPGAAEGGDAEAVAPVPSEGAVEAEAPSPSPEGSS